MSTFVFDVRVMLKPSVNDPQGLSIRNALRTLGFDGVQEVRAGKIITLTVSAEDEAAARTAVTRMSDKLLANPVIETFEVSLSGSASPAL